MVQCFSSFQNGLERKHLEVEALNVLTWRGEHTFPARSTAHFTPRSSRLRDASGALDDMSLRKIAVAKRLGKVFCMGIRVCLFEGAHLTSSLSRSDGGDSGGLLKAVSQTFPSRGAAAAASGSRLHTYKTLNKLTC